MACIQIMYEAPRSESSVGSAAIAVALDPSLVGLVDSGDGLVMPDMQTAAFMQIPRIGFSARACPE